MHLNAYIQNRSKNIRKKKKETNEEKNNLKKKKKKRRIRKGIKKKTCLSSHNQLNEIVTTSRARVQKTPQLLSFRMRAHGVYRNTHDKPLIYSGYDITLFHKTRGDGIGGTYRYRHARAT